MTHDPHVKPVERLVDIMATLRSENGCPWDREQTLETLKPYLVEEAYEVLEAIDHGDPHKHCEELGDLLLQVVFQSQLQQEAGAFSFDDVATAIADKLVRRHPHVFGDTVADTSEEVLKNWDAIKKQERGDETASILSGVPPGLPALLKAHEIQKRAARAGFDWKETPAVLRKVEEEVREIEEALERDDTDAQRAELGDLIFSLVNLARHLGWNTEDLLNQANTKFTERFQQVEHRVAETGQSLTALSLEELDAHWESVKSSVNREP